MRYRYAVRKVREVVLKIRILERHYNGELPVFDLQKPARAVYIYRAVLFHPGVLIEVLAFGKQILIQYLELIRLAVPAACNAARTRLVDIISRIPVDVFVAFLVTDPEIAVIADKAHTAGAAAVDLADRFEGRFIPFKGEHHNGGSEDHIGVLHPAFMGKAVDISPVEDEPLRRAVSRREKVFDELLARAVRIHSEKLIAERRSAGVRVLLAVIIDIIQLAVIKRRIAAGAEPGVAASVIDGIIVVDDMLAFRAAADRDHFLERIIVKEKIRALAVC